MKEKYCKLIKKTIKALDNNDVCTREMRETAIQAMKEVQQYHKLGTIEQCNEATKRAKAKKTIHRNGQQLPEREMRSGSICIRLLLQGMWSEIRLER